MKKVRFLNNYCPYIKGDIAGLDNSIADKYIAVGLVEEYKEDQEESKELENSREEVTEEVTEEVAEDANQSDKGKRVFKNTSK